MRECLPPDRDYGFPYQVDSEPTSLSVSEVLATERAATDALMAETYADDERPWP